MDGLQKKKKKKSSIFDELDLVGEVDPIETRKTIFDEITPKQELTPPEPLKELVPMAAHEPTKIPWWQKYDPDAPERAASEKVQELGRSAWDIAKRSKPVRLLMDPPLKDTLTPTGRTPTLGPGGVPTWMLPTSPKIEQERHRVVPPEEWWSNTSFLPDIVTRIQTEGDARPIMMMNMGMGGVRVFQPGPKVAGALMGVQDLAQGFATPVNAALMLALPAATGARLLKTAIEGKFAFDMISHALQQYPDAMSKFQDGDEEGGMRALVNALGGTALAGMLGRAAYGNVFGTKKQLGWVQERKVAKQEADLVEAQRRNQQALLDVDPDIVAKTIEAYGNLDPVLRGYYGNIESLPVEQMTKLTRGREILMERIKREAESVLPKPTPRERVVYEGKPTDRLDVWEEARAAEQSRQGFRLEEKRAERQPGTGEPGKAPPRVSPQESEVAFEFEAQLKNLEKLHDPLYSGSGESAIAPRSEVGGAGAEPISGQPSQRLPERTKHQAADIRSDGIPIQPDLSMDASDILIRIANGEHLGFTGTGAFEKYVPQVIDGWLEKFQRNRKVRAAYTPEEIQDFVSGIQQTRKIFGDEGFAMFPDVVKGKAVKGNVEYGNDFSLTSICGQQDLYNFVIREVERTSGKLLDPHKRFLVGEMISEAGGKPACFFCYGQGGRNAYEAGFEKLTDIFKTARKLKKPTEEQIKVAFQGWSYKNKEGNPSLLMGLVNKYGKNPRATAIMNNPVRLRDLAMGLKEPKSPLEADIAKTSNTILQGAFKPNIPKGYSPYLDEALRWNPAQVIKQNNFGGARINSQTDFRVWHTMDLAKFLGHLKARNSMAHVFTRQPAIIDIFGGTGLKFNVSMEFAHGADGKIMRYADGKPMIDEMNTMPYEQIQRYRKKYRRDVGSMLVALTKADILEGLRNPDVDMVIPNHRGKVAKESLAHKGAEDFTKFQNDKWGSKYKGRADEVITVKLKDGSEVKVTVGENLKRNQHHNNKARYLEIIKKLGITPRFAEFVKEKGYMKLVRDVARQPSRQRVVDPNKIDWDAASRHIDRWKAEGGEPFEGPKAAKSAEADAMLRWVQSRIKDNDWPTSPIQKPVAEPFTVGFAGGGDIQKIATDIVRRLRNTGVPESGLSAALRRIVDRPAYTLTPRQVAQAITDSKRKPKPVAPVNPDKVVEQLDKILYPVVAKKKFRIPKNMVAQANQAMQTAFTSQMAPMKFLQRDVYRQAGLKMPVQNIARDFELVAGAPAKAQGDIIRFKQALEPIMADPKMFNRYLFLKRTADRLDIDPQTRKVGDYTLDKAEAYLDALRRKMGNEKFNELEGTAIAYQELMDQALRLQVESGRMSEMEYQAIKKMNNFYAPFKVLRELEAEQTARGAGRGVATTRPLTERIKGIDDAEFYLGDIIQASSEYIVRSRMLAEKNAAMLELDRLAEIDTDGLFLTRFKGPQFVAPRETGGKGHWVRPKGIPEEWEVIPYLRNGERWAIATNPQVAQAVSGLNAAHMGFLWATTNKVNMPFRAGATAFNISFQPINLFLADLPRQMIMSKYGVQLSPTDLRYPFDWTYSLYSSFTGNWKIPGSAMVNKLLKKLPTDKNVRIHTPDDPTGLYMKALDVGVLNSSIQRELSPKAFERELKLRYKAQNTKERLRRVGEQAIDSPAKWSNAFEETTKLLGVQRGWRIEKIDKLPEALRNQKMREMATEIRNYSGSPDFLRRGNVSKELSNKVLEILDLDKSFDDNIVLLDLNLLIWRGERVGLIGGNGSGKSVLFRCILDELQPTAGIIKIGPSISIGYYAQEHQTLSPDLSLIEEIWETKSMSEHAAVNFLRRFLFPYRRARDTVSTLSGGERSRMQLAKLMLSGANFLLLDEPTNNLDLPSCEVLEQALEEFEGTVLVISHDRYFLNRIADRIVELDDGALTEYNGDYTYYAEQKVKKP